MQILLSFVIVLPLFSFVVIGACGRYIGVYGSMVLSVLNMLGALFCSVILFIKLSFTTSVYVELWEWLQISGFAVSFNFRYYSLTSFMFLVVTFISSCVHIYSCVYMYTDPFLPRFMSYLSLFTVLMLILVSAGNWLVLFLGW